MGGDVSSRVCFKVSSDNCPFEMVYVTSGNCLKWGSFVRGTKSRSKLFSDFIVFLRKMHNALWITKVCPYVPEDARFGVVRLLWLQVWFTI